MKKRQHNGDWGEVFVALLFIAGPLVVFVGGVLLLGLVVMERVMS